MYTYRAKVLAIHDADTLRVDIDCGFGVWLANQPIRLNGVDAPELGTVEGRAARDWLRAQLPVGTVVTLTTIKDKAEKYGRMLGVVQLDGQPGTVNDALVAGGYARPYSGGAR